MVAQMDARGMFVADWLHQVRRTLAVGASHRLRELHPDLVAAYGDHGLADVVADQEVRLDYLAQALSCGCPELFDQHAEWLRVAFGGRTLPLELARTGLACLRDELADSLPEDARALAVEYLERGLAAFDRCDGTSRSHIRDDAPLAGVARRYLLAILEGRRQDAVQAVMDAADSGASPDDLLTHVVQRTQQELGRMWQIGDVHAAEEHFASRIAERLTTLLHARFQPAPRNGRKVLIASVGGNDHDLGSRFVADRFELAGWQVIHLGANTPAADVARAVQDFQPDLVALSTMIALHLRSTATVIAAIRALPKHGKVRVLVGGGPFLQVPDLWKKVGADGTASDAASAVIRADELVSA